MKKKLIFISISIFIILFISFVYIKYVSTKKLIVREYKIVSNNITYEYYGLKIIHFGDIHFGNNIDIKYLDKIVNEINLLKPDITIFTGDLVEKNYKLSDEDKENIINSLSKIESRLGKYSISGDEDLLLNDYPSIIKKSGFIYLENNFEFVYNSEKPILVSDMDSSNLDSDALYKILLIHEPDKLLNMDYSYYDLILAGHTHNGQIKLPFIGPLFKFNGGKTYYDNYYDLGNSKLYITGGIGTKKLNIRFRVNPSINLYRLTNK